MSVRPAAVAGTFYPADAEALAAEVMHALQFAGEREVSASAVPQALLVPHAGYIYSGQTAAFAYQLMRQAPLRRVVLFGPAHRVGFQGMALPEADSFQTPLGRVAVDREAVAAAVNAPHVICSDHAHALEHSLEVQLPFLQSVLHDFSLLPICVGSIEPEAVAELMSLFLGQPETVVVISSDLSHFHHYEEANRIDRATLDQILSHQGSITHRQACGATALNALLLLAEAYQLQPQLLDYRNSGDGAGDKNRVVGYASVAWMKKGDNLHE